MLGPQVLSEEEIGAIVCRLPLEKANDLEGRTPVFIGVLKGCVYFLTDLTRHINKSMEIDFIQV